MFLAMEPICSFLVKFMPTNLEELFSKCTSSYTKEHKLYNKLLNKISPEIELSVPDSFGKDRPTPVPILHTPIFSIQNNSSTCSSLPSLSCKFPSLLPTQGLKSLQQRLKRIMMLNLILRCNYSALNNLCNLLCRHHKKVLN